LACLIVALVSSRRLIGFWGGLALSVVFTPVLAVVLLVLTRPRSGRAP
jgi:hypothetical protein